MPVSDTQYEMAPRSGVRDLLPVLTYEFPDAPDGMLEYVAMQTVIKFCRRTNVLRRTSDITTQPCVPNYRLEPPDAAETELIAIMRIARVMSRGCVSDYSRVTVHDGRRCCLCHGPVIYADRNEIIFDPPPSHQAVFRVEFSVCPRAGTCAIDTRLLSYDYVLLDGIRAELFAQPNKPWSSAARAQACEVSFRQGCADVSVETMMHNQRGSIARRRRVF